MAAKAVTHSGCALRGKGVVHCLHCARRGDDAPSFRIRNTCVAHGVTLSMHSTCTVCVFVQRDALDARINCIKRTSAHVFGIRSRAHFQVICARSLYERSRNCVHHRPPVKSGTKSGSRFGDAIWARVGRRCTRQRALEACAARARGVCKCVRLVSLAFLRACGIRPFAQNV